MQQIEHAVGEHNCPVCVPQSPDKSLGFGDREDLAHGFVNENEERKPNRARASRVCVVYVFRYDPSFLSLILGENVQVWRGR